MRLLVVAVGLLPAVASASPPAERYAYALAVNEPLFWASKVIGVSAYVGLDRHHAIRANVANYPALGTQLTTVIAAPSGGSAGDRGGYFDVGVGWQWYHDELWSGPMVELGLVWRSDKTRQWDDTDQMEWSEVERDARAVVARGLLGWSWIVQRRLMISAAAGGAVGYQRGTEHVRLDDYTRYTRAAPALAGGVEGYLRFGLTF